MMNPPFLGSKVNSFGFKGQQFLGSKHSIKLNYLLTVQALSYTGNFMISKKSITGFGIIQSKWGCYMTDNQSFQLDINLLEYPIHFIGQKNKNNVFKFTEMNGYMLISGKKPTYTDKIILFYCLLKSGNDNKVETSYYEIIKQCGLPDNQRTYKRIKDALDNWISTSLYFDNSLYTKKDYITFNCNILQHYEYNKQKRKLYIVFTDKFMRLVRNSDYYKHINFDEIKRIKNPLSVRLYEILCKSFYDNKPFQIDIHKLAVKLTLQEKYISKIIPKLQSCVKTINKETDINIKMNVEKKGKNKGKVIFTKIDENKRQQKETYQPDFQKIQNYDDFIKDMDKERLQKLQQQFIKTDIQNNPVLKSRYKKSGFDSLSVQNSFISFVKRKQEKKNNIKLNDDLFEME